MTSCTGGQEVNKSGLWNLYIEKKENGGVGPVVGQDRRGARKSHIGPGSAESGKSDDGDPGSVVVRMDLITSVEGRLTQSEERVKMG